ncbi:DUF5302 domain-containing protein [Amycolatopsis cihanbeyliensis]|uniref:DUF5302 domain-containing protein n=1 Tax=Amycolatopsis cihanbeyliensis TaxID=1128664 RepID=A0A542CUD4_AMYCI|nr:DUF5302 domain-containing protein [Amycolatopsis cihanbeyliensis]TQI94432.1 hypothetical protein FB471_6597 [Amycolatopsis cihanbeyliensis]
MPDTTPAQENTEPEGDVKRQFREALERKQQRAKAGAAHEDLVPKITQTHGPAGGKRTFRRKSG